MDGKVQDISLKHKDSSDLTWPARVHVLQPPSRSGVSPSAHLAPEPHPPSPLPHAANDHEHPPTLLCKGSKEKTNLKPALQL